MMVSIFICDEYYGEEIIPLSFFNNSKNEMRLDGEYNTQVSRLNRLLNIAYWYMTNHRTCDEDNAFSHHYNSVSRPQDFMQQRHAIEHNRIPSEKAGRKMLAETLQTFIPNISTLLKVINGRKAEASWGTQVSELTHTLKLTCDMLDGTISFEEYAKLPDEIQGAPWFRVAFTLIVTGIGLAIAGCALAYIMTGPMMAAAVFSCLGMGCILMSTATFYYLPRTGLSSFAWILKGNTENYGSDEKNIQALFQPINIQDGNNLLGSVTFAYFSENFEPSQINNIL